MSGQASSRSLAPRLASRGAEEAPCAAEAPRAAALLALLGAVALLALPGARPAAAAGLPRLAPAAVRLVVPGRPTRLVWPGGGEAAVAVAGIGLLGASPQERRVPIASLTKMMTALVVLADHPLRPGDAGPTLTISAEDVQDYSDEAAAGDSTVKVAAGEVLSEYQLLEGLLLPSGDNIADRLALWDAGGIPAFVAKMNAMAAAFGLRATHYADASGVDPRSSSDASDQAFIASQLIGNPLIRAIVRHGRVAFPVVGSLRNRNPALGIDGIVGLKSGFSSKAHNCLVTVAYRSHHRAIVISVVLGQPTRRAAALIDERLLEAATRKLEFAPLLAAGAPFGTLNVPGSTAPIALFASGPPPRATVWPGLALSERAGKQAAATPEPGALAGEIALSAPWGALATIPVRTAPLPGAAAAAAASAAAALAAGELANPGG